MKDEKDNRPGYLENEHEPLMMGLLPGEKRKPPVTMEELHARAEEIRRRREGKTN